MTPLGVELMYGPARVAEPPPFLVLPRDDDPTYRALRRRAFVEEQALFAGDDADERDGAPGTSVLVAVGPDGAVLGGVRLHPEGEDAALGWWRGSRLVVADGPLRGKVGAALVQAASAAALQAGALRFDAHVQEAHVGFFARLGWEPVRPLPAGHRLMRWPVDRIAALVAATKAPLGPLLSAPGAGPGDGWRGDDGVPVGGGTVACVDAILPRMVERDPEWAGWCGMLVTAHDLSAMGAAFAGALDTVGARDAAHAGRVLCGLVAGAEALRLPLLGGHTSLGVPASLSVSGLGHAERPVPGGGGRVGDRVALTADLEGSWRPGYRGAQWDSTSWRSSEELAAMLGAVRAARPAAAKDVSMAGIAGTAGMLAEACGTGVELEVAAIPRPEGVDAADWLTCFPGFGMLTAGPAGSPGAARIAAGPAVGATVGRLTAEPGVRLRWPDGDLTLAVAGGATGLGPA